MGQLNDTIQLWFLAILHGKWDCQFLKISCDLPVTWSLTLLQSLLSLGRRLLQNSPCKKVRFQLMTEVEGYVSPLLERRVFSGLRVWRSQLPKQLSWILKGTEYFVPPLAPSHGWFSSKEYLLLFNNAVVYRLNSWLNREYTGCRPSKEMIDRLCLLFKKKKEIFCFF